MKLLIWGDNIEAYKDAVSRLVEQIGSAQVIRSDNFADFRHILIEQHSEIGTLLLAPDSLDSLKEALEQKELFNDLRLVIALPDNDTESLNLALKLFPRYVSQANDPPGNIELVLMKMLGGKRSDDLK